MTRYLPTFCKTAAAVILVVLSASASPETAHGSEPQDETFIGIVAAVEDGDTLTFHTDDGRCIEVRMSDYDSPEIPHHPGEAPACGGKPSTSWPPQALPGQPGGLEAGAALRSLALGKRATAVCHGSGGYGRLACHVTVDGQPESLNRQMIRAGWGWVFDRPDWVRDREAYRLEGAVRADQTGWRGSPASVEPYRWRRDCWNKGKVKWERCPMAVLN